MDTPIEVFVTCPDDAAAERVARAAIEARLAACANVSAPIRSFFHWQGRIEIEGEVELRLKSRAGCAEALAALIRETHPYEVPAILWAGMSADEATATWIGEETDAP